MQWIFRCSKKWMKQQFVSFAYGGFWDKWVASLNLILVTLPATFLGIAMLAGWGSFIGIDSDSMRVRTVSFMLCGPTVFASLATILPLAIGMLDPKAWQDERKRNDKETRKKD